METKYWWAIAFLMVLFRKELLFPVTWMRTRRQLASSTPAAHLRLPFDGSWRLHNTGEGALSQLGFRNHHTTAPTQRYAFDAIIVTGDTLSSSHTGSGAYLEHYHCYDVPILAAHQGTVVVVVDGIPDEKPGVMNGYMAFGNVVMIQSPHGWVSVYAHLKRESTTVQVGDDVVAGHTIGRCGNSGNSTEPHLHFHIQNTTSFHRGHGNRLRFDHVRLAGSSSACDDYTPRSGDVVSPDQTHTK